LRLRSDRLGPASADRLVVLAIEVLERSVDLPTLREQIEQLVTDGAVA